MSQEFETYKKVVTSFAWQTGNSENSKAEWQRMHSWYTEGGRQNFIDAFYKETGLRLHAKIKNDALVEAALPKSFSDLERKIKDDTFYRAHGLWFLQEMDLITSQVPKDALSPAATWG